MEFIPHVIDGQQAESVSGDRFASVDPWIREPYAEVALGRADDADRAVRAAYTPRDGCKRPRYSPEQAERTLRYIAERLTGWLSHEAAGKPMQDVFRIVNEYTRAIVENPVEKVLREGVIVGLANHTLLIARDGSETPIEDSAAPIVDAHGQLFGVVLVFRDASTARTTERTLLEADRRKNEFLAVLAHELRNPLAPIRHAALIARSSTATPTRSWWPSCSPRSVPTSA